MSLAWYDSPHAYRFHIEAIGESGRVYQVPARCLAPYDLPFAQGRFYYLTERPQLSLTLGAVFDRGRLSALEGAAERGETARDDGVAALLQHFGLERADARKADRFDAMLRLYFAQSPSERRFPGPQVPQHIWSAPLPELDQAEYLGQEAIVRARVRLIEIMHHRGRSWVVHDSVVSEVDLREPGSRGPELDDQ